MTALAEERLPFEFAETTLRPRISLIAHGTTKALRAATFGGDDTLDDMGRRSAARAAGRLGQVDNSFSSPARRAVETAALMGLRPAVDLRLRECDFGRWTGMTFNQVLVREPRKLVSWIRKPASGPHGGETVPQVMARVAEWMEERSRSGGHTVAVTHASVVRAAIVHAIEAELPSFWRIDVSPMTKVDFRTNGRRWVFRSMAVIGEPVEAESGAASEELIFDKTSEQHR